MIPDDKLSMLKTHFGDVVDKGSYVSCIMKGTHREWMYSTKLINELSLEKLEKLIKSQTS